MSQEREPPWPEHLRDESVSVYQTQCQAGETRPTTADTAPIHLPLSACVAWRLDLYETLSAPLQLDSVQIEKHLQFQETVQIHEVKSEKTKVCQSFCRNLQMCAGTFALFCHVPGRSTKCAAIKSADRLWWSSRGLIKRAPRKQPKIVLASSAFFIRWRTLWPWMLQFKSQQTNNDSGFQIPVRLQRRMPLFNTNCSQSKVQQCFYTIHLCCRLYILIFFAVFIIIFSRYSVLQSLVANPGQGYSYRQEVLYDCIWFHC